MPHISSSQGTKRKMGDSTLVFDPLSQSTKITWLGSSLLLLEIPADTDTSFPVWESVRSQELDISWTVNPYSICIDLTPVTSMKGTATRFSKRKKMSSRAEISAPSSSILQPHPVSHAIPQQRGALPTTPCAWLSLPYDSLQLLPSCPEIITANPPPATSLLLSLPLIIHHSQPSPINQVVPATTTKTLRPTLSKVPVPPAAFHTRNYYTKICDNFLLSECAAGSQCKMHHTALPFHWQIKHGGDQNWLDFPLHSQVLIERVYCEVHHNRIFIRDGNSRYSLNFDLMEFDDLSNYSAIRRLTNSEDPAKNPHFPSEWKFYWRNDLVWEKYSMTVSNLLLKAMNEKKAECFFCIGSQQYKVNFNIMVQCQISTGLYKDVRYRPVYRCPDSMKPYLRTRIQTDPSEPVCNHSTANFSVNPLEEFTSWYPPVWCLAPKQDYSLLEVPASTLAYKTIKKRFFESLSEIKVEIISIQQVQNRLHWDKYQRHKVSMMKQQGKCKKSLEKHLFHGTSKSASEDICHNNFDHRMSGVNGISYGKGSYFATESSFSDIFTHDFYSNDVCHMFLAKVLVGKVSVGSVQYCRPPLVNSETSEYCHYDTCVDNMTQPKMFVVFDSCQCYPYYIIKYSKLPIEVSIR